MNGVELQSLASMYRHQTHGIQVEGRGRNLPQIALLGEKNKLADAVEGAPDRQPRSSWASLAHEVQELPHGDRSHPRRHSGRTRHLADKVRPVE